MNASGTTVTVKDEDQYEVVNLRRVELARISNTRIIAAAHLSNNQMEAVCYDVNESTNVITRKGNYLWNSTMQRITMSAFGVDKLGLICWRSLFLSSMLIMRKLLKLLLLCLMLVLSLLLLQIIMVFSLSE